LKGKWPFSRYQSTITTQLHSPTGNKLSKHL
jgi:hypothetical protein